MGAERGNRGDCVHLIDSGEDEDVNSTPETEMISVSVSVSVSVCCGVLIAGLGDGIVLFFW